MALALVGCFRGRCPASSLCKANLAAIAGKKDYGVVGDPGIFGDFAKEKLLNNGNEVYFCDFIFGVQEVADVVFLFIVYFRGLQVFFCSISGFRWDVFSWQFFL